MAGRDAVERGGRCESHRVDGVALVDVEDEHELVELRVRHYLTLQVQTSAAYQPQLMIDRYREDNAEGT